MENKLGKNRLKKIKAEKFGKKKKNQTLEKKKKNSGAPPKNRLCPPPAPPFPPGRKKIGPKVFPKSPESPKKIFSGKF